ncbi:MAG: NfeD family protein [Scytolyngbya sp. HA4215-MV1]|jgi:hypothetical protein|nr:NfeD family protein [Scytolyngbya sp. HA4215-MV1]
MLNFTRFFRHLFGQLSHPIPGEACSTGVLPLEVIDCLSPLGNEAIVTRVIQPIQNGQIKFQGSWWTARCNRKITLVPGDVVRVIGRLSATTLIVEPIPLLRCIEGSRHLA